MAKAVICLEGGIAQSVLADGEDVEVIILARDIDGIEADNPRLRQFEVDTYYVAEDVDFRRKATGYRRKLGHVSFKNDLYLIREFKVTTSPVRPGK